MPHTADIDLILKRVRLEAQQPHAGASKDCALTELLSKEGEECVQNAYRVLLHRDADEDGLGTYSGLLRDGTLTREEMLWTLRRSAEGQSARVRVPGLRRAAGLARLRRSLGLKRGWSFPAFRNLVRGLRSLNRLAPRVEKLEQLLDDEDRRAETLREIERQLAHLVFVKADRNGVDELQHRLTPALSEKADRDEVAELRRRLEPIFQELATSGERAANTERRLDAVDSVKADRDDVASLCRRLDALAEEVGIRGETVAEMERLLSHLAFVKADRSGLDQIAKRVATTESAKADRVELAEIRNRLDEIDRQLQDGRAAIAARSTTEELGQLATRVEEAVARKADRDTLSEVGDRLAAVEVDTALREAAQQALEPRLAGFDEMISDLAAEQRSSAAGLGNTLADHRRNLLDQQRRLTILLETARRRLPEPLERSDLQKLAREEQHSLDSLYVSFEDRFRGTRQEIRDRHRLYLPYLNAARKRTGLKDILDVACGRGELVELLAEEGLVAQGVDRNRVMARECRDHGLEVTEGEAIENLRERQRNSLAAVTAMHFIEHVDFPVLVALLDECLRVLKPGGVAIFETPNARNLLVAAGDFYRDPTHRAPVFPDTLEMLGELRGFSESTAYVFDEARTQLSPLRDQKFDGLDAYLTVSRDLAWMGIKR